MSEIRHDLYKDCAMSNRIYYKNNHVNSSPKNLEERSTTYVQWLDGHNEKYNSSKKAFVQLILIGIFFFLGDLKERIYDLIMIGSLGRILSEFS